LRLPSACASIDDMDGNAKDDALGWLEGSGVPGGGPVRRIETHAAVILLAGERAWKLKKPVRFGYLDFSTPERRGRALEEELRLNRRNAPELYLALHKVTRDAAGAYRLDGEGRIVDWVLEMRRFPDDALLADRADAGRLDEGLLLDLADHIVALHGAADVRQEEEGAGRLRCVVGNNRASMAAFPDILPPEAVGRLEAHLLRAIDARAGLLDRRAREGHVRHVHGDLHLGNIALVEGRPVAFDRLEFDAGLATIDLLYDLAFLLMDLWQRGLKREASLVFNRYLDLSPGEEDGVGLLPLFMAVRASIRAHVLAASADQGQEGRATEKAVAKARAYLALALWLAERLTQEASPCCLVAIGGLSGTGKSTLARALAAEVGPAPGARILRSDVLRKRLAGVAPEETLPGQAYTRASSGEVYGELARLAARALDAGAAVIADAVFSSPEERAQIAGVPACRHSPFAGLWLVLGEAGRVSRVETRRKDASDATADVVRMQTRRHPDQPEDWIILDAAGAGEAVASRARAALEAAFRGAENGR